MKQGTVRCHDISWTVCKLFAPWYREITMPAPHCSISTVHMLLLKHWRQSLYSSETVYNSYVLPAQLTAIAAVAKHLFVYGTLHVAHPLLWHCCLVFMQWKGCLAYACKLTFPVLWSYVDMTKMAVFIFVCLPTPWLNTPARAGLLLQAGCPSCNPVRRKHY